MDKNNPEFFIRFKSLNKLKSFQNDMEKSKMELIYKLRSYKIGYYVSLAVLISILAVSIITFSLTHDSKKELRAQVQMYKDNCECKAIMFKEINE